MPEEEDERVLKRFGLTKEDLDRPFDNPDDPKLAPYMTHLMYESLDLRSKD